MEFFDLYDDDVLDLLENEVDIINANLKKWVKEAKLDQETKVDWEKLKELFNSITKKTTRVFPEKAKRQFRARLKEGWTKEDIRNAIINAYESDWHRDSNYKWLTLEFISRADKFTMYVEMGRNKRKESL